MARVLIFLFQMKKVFYCENFLYLLYICYLTVFVYDFSENIFKSVNIMSCHKLNEQNGVDAEEFEDCNEKIMVLKHLVEELRQVRK